MARELRRRLLSWEGLLFVMLVIVIGLNTAIAPGYLTAQNQVNLFELGVEKAIMVLAMTFVIVSGEIDLSVASILGLTAVVVATMNEGHAPMEVAIVAGLAVGLACGLFNGFWIAVVGLPSLAVTLAGLIGFRGLARIIIEDRSIGGFPDWFDQLGQQPLVGPFPAALILLAAWIVVATILLGSSGFGRYVYVLGSSAPVARFSGVRVVRVRMVVFAISAVVAAVAGILLAARLGAVRGSTGEGFELDIITIVLLGGVSIFGGTGTMTGVILSLLLILNIRNGLGLANVTGNTQTGVVGALLLLSVLVPNVVASVRARRRHDPDAAPPLPAMQTDEAA